MAKINGREIPKELLVKAMACETPEELMKLAKERGVELTAEEAQAFLDEMEDIDLEINQLKSVAGGGVYACPDRSCPKDVCNDNKPY